MAAKPNSELHEEFRSLTVLLSLVSCFNNDNHPESRSLRFHRERALRRAPPPEPELQSRGNFALTAITTLLARDVEVIAAAAEEPAEGTSPRTKMSFVVAAQPREQENLQKLDVLGIRWQHILDSGITILESEAKDACVLVPPGKSHWLSIGRREWHGFKIRGRDPLNNHVATLVEYFNSLKQASLQEQSSLFQTFMSYVVSSCWKKMHRRISHWLSQGFIYCLGSLPHGMLRFSYREYAPVRRESWRDSVLGNNLQSLSHKEIVRIMNQHPVESHPKPTLLLAAFKKMSEHPDELAYNSETSIEFHHFFVAALASYTKALANLHTVSNTKGSMGRMKEAAAEVKKSGFLFWMFAHTPMLQHHLEGLRLQGALYMPLEASRGFYRSYLGFGDPLGEQDEDGDVDVELCHLARNDHRAGIDKIVLKWTRLLVNYFEAVHRLSDYYRRHGDQVPDVEISLLAVKTPYLAMEPWEHTIRKAIIPLAPDHLLTTESPFNAEAAMSLIKGLGQNADATRSRKFDNMLSVWGRNLFSGTVHCDAALASLIKHSDAIDSIFGSPSCVTIENLSQSFISVSRPCCPVCWELMAILSENPRVRDRQATISPVALPVWLPVDVLQQMVDRFRDRLRDELTVMFEEGRRRTVPLPSPSPRNDDDYFHRMPAPTLHLAW